MDFTATDTATFTQIAIRSVNTIFLKVRRRIALTYEMESSLLGAVEVDESYFGARAAKTTAP